MNISEKQCSKCKLQLDVSSFNKRKIRKDGTVSYQPFCKECNKINSRKYYSDNREKHIKVIYQRKKKQMEKHLSTDHPILDAPTMSASA